MLKYFLIFSCCILAAADSPAQRIVYDEQSTAPLLSPIGSAFNRIFNDFQLDSVYIKMAEVKKNKRKVFRIVHIGDSHVQAGHFPGEVRLHLQEFFGNAGRGLVFPYNAINTTSPPDISSSSNTGWKVDKVATNGEAKEAGVSGYGMKSGSAGASVEIALRTEIPQPFTRLRFFLGNETENGWILRTDHSSSSLMVKAGDRKSFISDIKLENPSTGFILSTMPSNKDHHFFGVSLENDNTGIIYHSIGVNGARYDQYNKTPLFWDQLPGLEADLFIISLGTNEAQVNKFDGGAFRKELNLFLQKLQKASPNVPVIITTAPDSYRNGRSNMVLRDLNMSLFEYCTEKSIPVWDLYRVTNGYGSAYGWLRRGLMNYDMVHFTGEGYQLLGQLLFNALAKGYNDFHGY